MIDAADSAPRLPDVHQSEAIAPNVREQFWLEFKSAGWHAALLCRDRWPRTVNFYLIVPTNYIERYVTAAITIAIKTKFDKQIKSLINKILIGEDEYIFQR